LKSIATAGRGQPAALVAIGTAGALLLLGAGSAVAATRPAAAGSPAPGQVAVPQGVGAAALKNAQVVGQAAASKKEQVSFILNARNLGSLKAKVATGGWASYLTVSQFASTYGQTSANIDALVRYLRKYGITSHVLADHLDVSTTGTVADYNKALRVSQKEYKLAAKAARHGRLGRPAASFAGTAQPATLPTSVGKYVLTVLGLTAYPAAASNAVHTPALPHGTRPAATQKGNLTPASFASRYDLAPVQQAGHLGQGQTIGIVTLASMRASDATHFWSTTLKIATKANRLTLDNVDGGAGKVSDEAGSGETTLDVEQSGALAPDANIDVYQAPNTDGGFIDAFATAASQNHASAVSSSWGDSETFIDFNAAARKESARYAQAFNEIFLEMAAQGQSSFIAAGDSGAYDAYGDQGSTNLSVDEPGSSPYTTDAGGTTLPGTIPVASGVSATISSERAWGWDWLWPSWKKLGGSSEKSFAEQNLAGGGGGFSVDQSTPFYQAHWLNVHSFSAVKYLTPIDFVTKDGVRLPTQWNLTAKPAVTTGTGTGRAVPDLSADADPYTGYEEYFTGFSGNPLETGWGGTSFVAPQLAGTTAVIDSAVGHRVGFWNPSIYRFAAGSNSPFTPLDQTGTGNDNLYYTGTKGSLFNAGTGLGTPDFARLVADFG
jgi:kumamolisin